MRKFRFLVLFVLVLGLTLLSGVLPKYASAEDTVSYELYIKYFHSSKMYYFDIEIKDSHMTATYVNEEKRNEHWDENPNWEKDDLETIEKNITNEEIEELKTTIKDSNFFDLKDIEGATDEDQKYQAYILTVTFEGKTKTVECRHAPDAPECPEVWFEIEALLWNFAGLGC